jgi:hypothetical protein
MQSLTQTASLQFYNNCRIFSPHPIFSAKCCYNHNRIYFSHLYFLISKLYVCFGFNQRAWFEISTKIMVNFTKYDFIPRPKDFCFLSYFFFSSIFLLKELYMSFKDTFSSCLHPFCSF